jgi:hypothetical protein
LTGYAGGLHRKQWLLEHESPYIQQRLFEWSNQDLTCPKVPD